VQRDLVEAAQRGDHEAFEALAISTGDLLFAIARLILRDVDRAQDAVQEALVQAWRALPQLRDPDKFDAWMRKLVVNSCSDQIRRQKRWHRQLSLVEPPKPADDASRTWADRDQLERGFRRLTPAQRTAIVLRYYLDLTVPEVADALGIPEGTAKSRLHHAMAALRAALDADARTSTDLTERTA
jgi:RNA polymerase sigma-70 factor (sigma-E family)